MTGLRALPLETYPPFNRNTADLIRDADVQIEKFRTLLLGHSWDLMHASSADLAGLADLLLRNITIRTDLFGTWGSYLSERDSGLKSVFAELSGNTSAEADGARAAMMAELEATLGSSAAAAEFLAKLLAGEGALFTSRGAAKSALADEQELTIDWQIQLAVTALRADIEASIFKARADIATAGLGPVQDADTETVAVVTQSLVALHDGTVHDLYDALRTGVDRAVFADLCEARLANLGRRAPTGAVLLGGYLGLLQPAIQAPGAAERATAALGLVDAVTRIRLVHAYLVSARAHLAALDPDRWYSNEKRRTESRQESSLVPGGAPHTISDVADASVAEGTFVRLEGRVEALGIEDDPAPPKFSSFFELRDHATGVPIRVRAHMFSLANNGLRDGSLAILNGYVRLAPPWSAGPGIDIDRVSLSDLRKGSWYDDLTYRMRTSVQLFQDEMNMTATTSPLGS